MADSFVNEDSRKDNPTSVVLSGEVERASAWLSWKWTEQAVSEERRGCKDRGKWAI